MSKTINSIEAAKLERDGKAMFSIVGRNVVLTRDDGRIHSWPCKTIREANETLRLFRASLKHVK